MGHIAIVTDSNSGISQNEAKEMGIFVIPMPFFINETVYYEDIDLSQEQFYKMLSEDADVSTSQPSPGNILDMWDDVLRQYSEIVHIPMSSGLSTSCETAQGLAKEYKGKVEVVNNQRVSVTMQQSVRDAAALVKQGKSAKEIREILEAEAFESSIYLMVDTLKYLKKGGRITPAAALLGSALKLKPILQIQGEKLDAYKKVRGIKAAKKNMLDAMRNDVQGRFAEYVKKGELNLHVAYTTSEDEAKQWTEEVKEAFPEIRVSRMDPLALSIVCHTGPGVLAIAASHSLEQN
jgi:DegV family protein with EDD domain